MKNLTFTLFFLSFFLSGNGQDYGTQLKLTHEDDIVISNSTFKGRLTSSDRINIQSLPSGLYFTEIITEKGSVTKKVVKL
jgi:hypothetical protein